MRNPWNEDDPYTDGNPAPGGGEPNDGGPGDPHAGLVYTDWDEGGNYQYPGEWVTPDVAARRQAARDKLLNDSKATEGKPKSGSPAPNDTPPSSPRYNFKPVPQFKWDEQFTYGPFVLPTEAEAQKEPGYQFRLNQGAKALEQSAAARGLLNTGGTAKDLLQYGQNFASAEYQNVANRALQAYQTNYAGARDQYQTRYDTAKDKYAPNLLEWSTLTAAEQRRAELALANLWQQWFFNHISATDLYRSGLV